MEYAPHPTPFHITMASSSPSATTLYSANHAVSSDVASASQPLSLTCTLASNNGSQQVLQFRPDESKKAAYWIDPPGEGTATASAAQRAVAAPAHCSIACDRPVAFFLGGFQLVSNAKAVEVSLDGQYLTTCRGIPTADHPGCFKALYVVPGGPRSVQTAALKLLSLQPSNNVNNSSPVARLVAMKLTARLPDPSGPPGGAVAPPDPCVPPAPSDAAPPSPGNAAASSQSREAPHSPEPPLDVQSVLAALSMVARSTEERVVQSTAGHVRQSIAPLQEQLQQFATTVSHQLQLQHRLLVQQQALLEAQHLEIRELRATQAQVMAALLQLEKQDSATPRIDDDDDDDSRSSPMPREDPPNPPPRKTTTTESTEASGERPKWEECSSLEADSGPTDVAAADDAANDSRSVETVQ